MAARFPDVAHDQARRGWSKIITIFQWVLIFEQSVNHDADRDGGRKLARLRGLISTSRCSTSEPISPARPALPHRSHGPSPALARTPGFLSSPITACHPI